MPAAVVITKIKILDNPAPFTSPFKMEITYKCSDGNLLYAVALRNVAVILPILAVLALVKEAPHSIQWKLIYLQKDESNDKLLQDAWDEPVELGTQTILLEVDAPNPSKLLKNYILGNQLILLSGSYAGMEFVHVLYDMINEYVDENLRKDPPQNVLIERVQRNLQNPRVEEFPINFHPENAKGGGQAAPGPGKRRRLRSRL
ncbi:hypothetical protein LguiB_033218 [Lonicera macranthoides]